MIRIIISALVLALLVQPAEAQNPPAGSPLINNTPGYNNKVVANMTLLGQQSLVPCPLTAASTITINLSACPTAGNSPSAFTVTLTSNTIFQLPSPFPINEVFFNLIINHGTGPYTATLGSGWYFQNGSMNAAVPNNQPTLSTGIDELACHTVPSPQEVYCGALTGITAAIPYSFSFLATSCGSGAATTCASGSFPVTNGDTLIALVYYCPDTDGCVTSSTSSSSSVSGSANINNGSCSAKAKNTASLNIKTDIYRCSINGTGNTVVTVTFPSSFTFSQIHLLDVTNLAATDDGVGNTSSGTGTSATVSTNGNTSQINEFIVATGFPFNTSSGGTAGAGYTFFPSSLLGAYSVVNSTGSNSITLTYPNNGSSAWATAIAAFK